ncbi:hypothetical protein [Xenorhabdus sp. PB30.3]|uniref:hypothetical protein n=1 Tax=Xenorhabdus sp. PB30.3 TaxID=2788941 RepID=UPI001E45A386|nr:hypothetical protein [Xenorhabdus sp. PB30.3]MCC8379741.1 hypothetical protein [Xenorhabdus sp. PB30.3]
MVKPDGKLSGFAYRIGSPFKHKLQGANSLIIYLSNMLASLSVGMEAGWYILNIVIHNGFQDASRRQGSESPGA